MSYALDCAIVGAGGLGTALAASLGRNNKKVALWARKQDTAAKLAHLRENTRYLPGIILPEEVIITPSLEEILPYARIVVVAVPVRGMREVARCMAPFISKDSLVISGAKGLEVPTGKRMSEILKEELGTLHVGALSGPNHAEEMGKGFPAVSVLATTSEKAEEAQEILMGPDFRVYWNEDLLGVELCGAVKNVIAIGAGVAEGLGYGDNTKAAVITRGLSELSRMAVDLGAKRSTCAGVAGMGDLIATCFSSFSRNKKAGERLALGEKVEEFSPSGMVIEGIPTAFMVSRMAAARKMELPIIDGVCRIIEGAPPKLVVDELMGRNPKREI